MDHSLQTAVVYGVWYCDSEGIDLKKARENSTPAE